MRQAFLQGGVSQNFCQTDEAVQFINGAHQLDPVVRLGNADAVHERGGSSVPVLCIDVHIRYSSLKGSFLIARALLEPTQRHCARVGSR